MQNKQNSKPSKEYENSQGKQNKRTNNKEKVTKHYTIVENGQSNVKTSENRRKTVVIESEGKLIKVDIVKSGNIEKSQKKKAKPKVEMTECDEVEIMSCDDSSESEAEFEIQTKKIKLSPNVETNKKRKAGVAKVKKASTKTMNKEASKRQLTDCKDDGIHNKTSAKKLKISDDQVLKKTSKKSADTRKVTSKSKKKVAATTKTSNKKKQLDKHSPVKKTDVDMLSQIDHTDVTAVLLHMEGGNSGMPFKGPGTSTNGDLMDDSSSQEEEESDWEEVEDHPGSKSPDKSQISKEPIEITLDVPEIIKHRYI
ncbi:hypothetical protein KUTeg_021296 [Tegillarca granosa]|uniref:Uncharacterized protein n=1 Tax=Tegillarca granosa TaxID=220873 RepID=A0ABQ9ECM8_TEGGR|nr:hypothetical protein KUTeg_021296 [Tegillarca granosa]